MFINCVFEGGGIKGLAYVGVIQYLEEHGIQVYQCTGTSVGAIFSALIVSRFNSKEIKQIIDEITIKNLGTKNDIYSGIKGLGVNNIKSLENTLDKVLARKGVHTFQNLKHGDNYLLRVITTDYKKRKMVILPDDLNKYGYNRDDFKVSSAIAMSCNLPFVYSVYTLGDNKFIDGGLVNRFPTNIKINQKFPTYAFRLSSDNSILNQLQTRHKNINADLNNNIRIVPIDIPKIKSTNFQKGLDIRTSLYDAGYKSIKKYMNNL